MIALGLSRTPSARMSPKSRSNVTTTLSSARPVNKRRVRSALKSQSSDVNRFVTKLVQELDRFRRDSSICQKPHASGAERVHLVLSEGSGVGERLADIFLFEVGQFLHNLGWRHAVGDEVHDVSHRNAKATNRRSPREHVRVLCDAIVGAWRDLPPRSF